MGVWMCLGTDDRYKSCQSWHKSCIARSLGIECIYPLYKDSCWSECHDGEILGSFASQPSNFDDIRRPMAKTLKVNEYIEYCPKCWNTEAISTPVVSISPQRCQCLRFTVPVMPCLSVSFYLWTFNEVQRPGTIWSRVFGMQKVKCEICFIGFPTLLEPYYTIEFIFRHFSAVFHLARLQLPGCPWNVPRCGELQLDSARLWPLQDVREGKHSTCVPGVPIVSYVSWRL